MNLISRVLHWRDIFSFTACNTANNGFAEDIKTFYKTDGNGLCHMIKYLYITERQIGSWEMVNCDFINDEVFEWENMKVLRKRDYI